MNITSSTFLKHFNSQYQAGPGLNQYDSMYGHALYILLFTVFGKKEEIRSDKSLEN